MIARSWRGWTGLDCADEVAAHLRDVILARYASSAGNVSASVLRRPSAGGVELMTLTVWESREALPDGVAEDHRLLVARQTIPDLWELAAEAAAVVRAA